MVNCTGLNFLNLFLQSGFSKQMWFIITYFIYFGYAFIELEVRGLLARAVFRLGIIKTKELVSIEYFPLLMKILDLVYYNIYCKFNLFIVYSFFLSTQILKNNILDRKTDQSGQIRCRSITELDGNGTTSYHFTEYL